MKKDRKTIPTALRKYVKFENGEIMVLPNLPFYLKPMFKKFKKTFLENKISDEK